MDYENQVEQLGYNTIIYAHNMRDGSMFHNLRYYNDEGYFEENKTISLQTLYEDTLWEIFSFYESNTEFLYNTATFNNHNEFLSFAELLREKSKHPNDVIFNEQTQILTLSTCTNRDIDSRYVVHAYRVR
jgi:sortase B